jgi:hypothetical protein
MKRCDGLESRQTSKPQTRRPLFDVELYLTVQVRREEKRREEKRREEKRREEKRREEGFILESIQSLF